MSHNLHFIAVVAEDGETACESALEHIENWGDDNNWRHACAAVCRTGKIYVHETGWVNEAGEWEEYDPETKETKAEPISWEWAAGMIEEAMRDGMQVDEYTKPFLEAYNAGEILQAHQYYSLRKHFGNLYQAHSAKETTNWYIRKAQGAVLEDGGKLVDLAWISGGELLGHVQADFVHKVGYYSGHYDKFGISCSYFEDDDVDPDELWLV